MTRDSILFYFATHLKSRVAFALLLGLTLSLLFKGRISNTFNRFLFLFSSRRVLYLALALGVFLRLVWIFFAPYETYQTWGKNVTESDVINIQSIELSQGKGISNEDGTPSGRRPAGYILFLAFFYKMLGSQPWIPTFLQVVLSVVIICLLYALFRKGAPPGIAGLVALFSALYPPFIFSVNIVLDEYLFLPLCFLGMLINLQTFPNLSWKKTIMLGVIWGLATVVRTNAIIMPIVAAALGLFYSSQKRYWFLKCLGMMAILLSINIPLAIRNYRAWKVPVYYTATGSFIYSTLNPLARGNLARIPQKGEPYYAQEFANAANEGEAHVIGLRLAKKWILENPKDFLYLTAQKALWFLSPDNSEWALNLHATTEERNGFKLPFAFNKIMPMLEKHLQVMLVYPFFFLLLIQFFSFRKILSVPLLTMMIFTIVGWIGLCSVLIPDVKYRLPIDLVLFPVVMHLFHLALQPSTDRIG